MRKPGHPNKNYRLILIVWFMPFCLAALSTSAQDVPTTSERLEDQLRTLSKSVGEMQVKLSQSQDEITALKVQVDTLQRALQASSGQGSISSSQETVGRLEAAVTDLKDQDEVLQAEISQHEQTKLETASKYPVKVTGLLLFSTFMNNGPVDDIDDPVLVEYRVPGNPKGSLAATARQSILGLDATGPQLWGAKSSADLRVDFFGGLAYADYTTSAGVVRLRTAHAELQWPQRSLTFALDKPLISPLSPTSFVGIGEPALAWSGNLWTWSPQLEVKSHADAGGSVFNYDFALIDPSAPGPPPSSGLRQPDASEQSRQPGYEFRASYALRQVHIGDQPLQIGAGGYYSRQDYTGHQHVDAWAGAADWMLPVSRRVELSGEFYRGRALGGLGGGAFKDVVTDPDSGRVYGLNDEGGWTQLKLRMSALLEANMAFGQDNAFAQDLYGSAEGAASDPYSSLARNRATTGNVIFRPKTYLTFSTEFRYLQSWPVTGYAKTAPVLGFGAGYLF